MADTDRPGADEDLVRPDRGDVGVEQRQLVRRTIVVAFIWSLSFLRVRSERTAGAVGRPVQTIEATSSASSGLFSGPASTVVLM